MFQKSLFEEDYSMDEVKTKLLLLSDLRDACHASSQALIAISTAMLNFDEPPMDSKELLKIVDNLSTVIEDSIYSSGQLIVKGSYRGEK